MIGLPRNVIRCQLEGAKVSSALDFYVPRPPAVTTESDYGRELFQELKRIREIAKQHINKAQSSQKDQYDKHSTEPVIKEGDLVMLKVDVMDRSFHGTYGV